MFASLKFVVQHSPTSLSSNVPKNVNALSQSTALFKAIYIPNKMCEYLITTVVSGKCWHKIEENPRLKTCEEADRTGKVCDDVKDVYFGRTTTRKLCPDCLAAAGEEDEK